MHQYDNTVTGA